MKKIQLHLAVIEITNKCNLKCKHCYNFFDEKEIICLDDFKKISKQLNKLGVNLITISGGEPMILGEKIKEYIKIANKYFKTVNLTTNGALINNQNIKYLKEINCIQISLDGPEKIHDQIRGVGTYKKSIRAIKIVKSNNIKCSIMMAVNDFNINFLKKVLKIAKKLDVPMGFERITNVGRAEAFLSLSKNNTKKLIGYSQNLNIKSTDPLSTVNNKQKREYLLKNKIMGGCMAGSMAIAIDTNMNVLPCTRLRIPIGNLKKSKLTAILKKSKLLKQLNNVSLLKGKCGKCPYKFICKGCRAASFAFNKDYLGEDPGCFITREDKKYA